MNGPIRVLVVEEDAIDRSACRRALSVEPGRFAVLEAADGATGLALAAAEQFDCILLDYRLPDLTGLEFLRHAAAGRPGGHIPPVLMLTGADNSTIAVEAIRRGAREYLVKDGAGAYLRLLPGEVERLLREQRMVEAQRRAEARFRTLVEQIGAISYVAAPHVPERLQYVSPQIRALGFEPEQWLSRPELHASCLLPEEREGVMAAIRHSRAAFVPLRLEYRLRTASGQVVWLRDHADPVLGEDGEPLCMQGILVDITADKLAAAELAASREQLRRLAAHQESIKEQERQRIARELHDELGGLLTGIKAYVSVAAQRAAGEGSAACPLLADAAALAQNAIDTMRRVVTDLRPSVLDQLGIWAALEWCTDQAAQRSGLECHCTVADDVAALALDGERSIMLFRIAQEALTNVVRHARAGHVRVDVRRSEGALALTVEDDGCGIDGPIAPDAWGIRGMQERARQFGGTLTVAPRPGGGTRLALRLPPGDAND